MKYCFFPFMLLLLTLTGCAGVNTLSSKPPVVSVESFKAVPQSGITPRFEIGLNILNPNSSSLSFEGLYYTVDVEGHRVLSGVTNELPKIPGYGEETIYIDAGVDLLSGINLFSSLMKKPRQSFSYNLTAELDPTGVMPKITVTEDGTFDLLGNSN